MLRNGRRVSGVCHFHRYYGYCQQQFKQVDKRRASRHESQLLLDGISVAILRYAVPGKCAAQ